MKFVPVDPEEVPNLRESRRGRVSYPILKAFMDSNLPIAMFDRTGVDRTVAGLQAGLYQYIKNHDLPIKIITRNGEMYFIRLDMDDAGQPVPNWRELEGLPTATPPAFETLQPLDQAVIAKKAAK